MKRTLLASLLLLALQAQAQQQMPHPTTQQAKSRATSQSPAPRPERLDPGSQIERGRYLIKIGGCNDCHTAGYGMAAGQVPEKDWLRGDSLGWQGPWGTTYATNLRLHFSQISEEAWLHQARSMRSRPPMPWFVFGEMSDADLRAIYAYMRQAGPAGQPAPAYAPPGQPVQGPVVRFPG